MHRLRGRNVALRAALDHQRSARPEGQHLRVIPHEVVIGGIDVHRAAAGMPRRTRKGILEVCHQGLEHAVVDCVGVRAHQPVVLWDPVQGPGNGGQHDVPRIQKIPVVASAKIQ